MKRSNVALSVTCAVALAAGAAAIQAAPHDPAPASKSAGSAALHKAMEDANKQSMGMKMKGMTDDDFAMMMSMHHKSAIAMAEVELQHGKDPKLQAMARNIIDSQKKEIAEFEAWMQAKGHGAPGHQR